MLNTRNQLDKIIITAMDRFVWFVLLVVISHLVTEFTRVTGFSRGPRQDVVMVNDSLIQPIKVQNLVLYPGQEYGLYEQQNQQYYNGNSLSNNYANNNNNSNKIASPKTNNFLSSLFNQFTNNNQNEKGQQALSPQTSNLPSDQGDAKTFSFRPIIESIFEIPISTLRAVTDMVSRLTGGYLQPQQQHQQQQQQQLLPQQQPPKYDYYSYPSYQASAAASYGLQRSADATPKQPKSQYETLNRELPKEATAITAAATKQNDADS